MTNYHDPAEINRQHNRQIETRVYASLAALHEEHIDNRIPDWLTLNGHISLTRCPRCERENFSHKEECSLGQAIAVAMTERTHNKIFFCKV